MHFCGGGWRWRGRRAAVAAVARLNRSHDGARSLRSAKLDAPCSSSSVCVCSQLSCHAPFLSVPRPVLCVRNQCVRLLRCSEAVAAVVVVVRGAARARVASKYFPKYHLRWEQRR
jgi:hypothetical protein